MGAYLSKPETNKHVEQGQGQAFEYAIAAMQGWRRTMEDAHTMIPGINNNPEMAFFGVFDGHGGPEVAQFCSKYMSKEMLQLDNFKKGDIKASLIEIFHKMDEMLMQQKYFEEIEGMRPKDPVQENENLEQEQKDDEGEMGLSGFLKRFLQRTTGQVQDQPVQDQHKEIPAQNVGRQQQSAQQQSQAHPPSDAITKIENTLQQQHQQQQPSSQQQNQQQQQQQQQQHQLNPVLSMNANHEVSKESSSGVEEPTGSPDIHTTTQSNGETQKDVDMQDVQKQTHSSNDNETAHQPQDQNSQGAVGATYQVASQALNSGIQTVQQNFEPRVISGCTAIVAFLQGKTLYVANAGDSRGIICRSGAAVALSEDHKPYSEIEKERIQNAGGFLSEIGGVYRVNGNLNLSRAIGDLRYKQNPKLSPKSQIITAEPDVNILKLQKEDEFIVLACDGVWDVMSNQEVCTFVKNKLKIGGEYTLKKIVCDLLDNCLARDPKLTRGLGGDNMTAILIQLKG